MTTSTPPSTAVPPLCRCLPLPDPPTALVALNDMHAVGACAAVREIGRIVPDHVSVVGIDDINLAALLDPPLTTVRHPIKALSEAAVDLLVNRIEAREHGACASDRFRANACRSRVDRDSAQRPRPVSGNRRLTRSAVNA